MKLNYQGELVNLPDFMLAGVAKAGTSFLYKILKTHPEIHMGSQKETYFFNYMGSRPSFVSKHNLENLMVTELSDYINLFSGAGSQLIGEATPFYFYDAENVVTNMKKVYGDQYKKVKMIFIFRDPIDRIWSHYQYLKSTNREDLDFADAISQQTISRRLSNNRSPFYDYVGFGLYAERLKFLLEEFDDVLIIDFDRLISDSQNIINECSDFLGIKYLPVNHDLGNTVNPTMSFKSSFISRIWATILSLRNKSGLFRYLPKNVKKAGFLKLKKFMTHFVSRPDHTSITPTWLRNKYKEDKLFLLKVIHEGSDNELFGEWNI